MEVNEAAGEGCRTPRHSGCLIPAVLACPPAPKKKPFQGKNKKQEMPKNGYFQPPDLEIQKLFLYPFVDFTFHVITFEQISRLVWGLRVEGPFSIRKPAPLAAHAEPLGRGCVGGGAGL
ncbi:hypothetical protein PVL29_016668 [Vitis rotundifolia]|uniref:Uncharacterized protein n=1 Tax=Vitis rotundifolia TaxID=103349 RepID=A0AA39DI01_VITRO|nr:hypothetical protein PVL29_016668 [Vitis rotundifolia]